VSRWTHALSFDMILDMTSALALNIVSTIAAVIAAIYAIVTYHRPKSGTTLASNVSLPAASGRTSRIIIFILSAIILLQGFFNYYLKDDKPLPDPILSYGIQAVSPKSFAYTMIVNGHGYLEYKDKYNLMLIVRVPYSNIDKMGDTAIEKSALYKILDEQITLAHVAENKLIITPAPGTMSANLEYTLVGIPIAIGIGAIISLGDVQSVGGKILADKSQSVPVVPAAPTNP
jgi:hypothetical protein